MAMFPSKRCECYMSIRRDGAICTGQMPVVKIFENAKNEVK